SLATASRLLDSPTDARLGISTAPQSGSPGAQWTPAARLVRLSVSNTLLLSGGPSVCSGLPIQSMPPEAARYIGSESAGAGTIATTARLAVSTTAILRRDGNATKR